MKKIKILYIASISVNDIGVIKKVKDQLDYWSKSNVELTFLNRGGQTGKFNGHRYKVFEYKSNNLSRIFDFQLNRIIKQGEFDMVYYRFGPMPLFFPSVEKLVVENNSRIETEKKHKSFVNRIFISIYHRLFKSRAHAVVGVTPECLEDFDVIPSQNKGVFGNAINISDTLFHEVIADKREGRVAVFVGSEGHLWHGLDRLIRAARLDQSIRYDIVGYSYEAITKSLPLNESIPKNVFIHGRLTGERLESVLRGANVAIGSLAMNLNDLKFSSSLKNRQYLQFGLPIVMQGFDHDLKDLDFVRSLPVDFDDQLLLSAIRDLLDLKLGHSQFEEIFKSISSQCIEERRLDFFKSILNNKKRRV